MEKKKSAGQGTKQIRFKHPVPVELTRLKVHLVPELPFLDLEKLDKAAKAEFEFGYVKVGKWQSTVSAVVRKGKVIGVRGEQCSQCEPVKMSAELRELLTVAKQKIVPGKPRPWKPIPVSEFVARQSDNVPERSEAWMLCLWFLDICIICNGFPSDLGSWSCTIIGDRWAR